MAMPPSLPSDSSTMAAACSTSVDDNRDKDHHRDRGGVVVVGFVGSRPTTDAAHLINRIIDADIFGSAAKDLPLCCFRHHRISYYYDSASPSAYDKGILFLLLSSSSSSLSSSSEEQQDEFESDLLRGMLFMFSVCHVILFLHEGLRFDTEILKRFRVLQAAKHSLSPFIRSQIAPNAKSSASPSQPYAPKANASSISISPPGRRTARHSSSSISLMSGSSTRPSALPGQCSPVILFVFCDDDLSDGLNRLSPCMEEKDSAEASYLTQPANGNSGIHKSSLTMKGSGSVVMLARPISKSEGSFKKKLHASLDAQIRFLIKKCRILVSTEPIIRGVGHANALPLFSLDASRVIVLINRSMFQRGESLDFVTGLVEDSFNSKGTSDVFMFGNQCQALQYEEIQILKDFIYRQSDILRGRSGLTSNANSGSVAGVGMVAAAAAAAAASAAAGKPFSAPELPSLENWLSSSVLIINALFSVVHGFMDEFENINGSSLQLSDTEMKNEQTSRLGTSAAEAVVSCLENSMGLNMKFSVSWCKIALPVAREVYLKDLPSCYPSSLHNTKLEEALNAFRSMVKGPALQTFTKKLEDECTHIWTSGRQLCDAVSLTGKSCMHQRHTIKGCDSLYTNVMNGHSSGFFFLHACACGRSRRLREDPFDFDSANVNFNCFANCEDILSTVVLPKGSNASPLSPTSWKLLRLGGARHYEPSKGLLQIGFCPSENFLLKWTISFDKQKGSHALSAGVKTDSSMVNSTPDPRASAAVGEKKKLDISKFSTEVQSGIPDNHMKSAEMVSSNDTNISFGKGLPSFTMKKPFSEVVAGTVLPNSTLPKLKHIKQQKDNPAKGEKHMGTVDQTEGQVHKADDRRGSQRAENVEVQESLQRRVPNYQTNRNPFLQIGSNLVPVNMCNSETAPPYSSQKQVVVYVGFEHECSYGHRFLLSPKHLMEFDPSYSTEVSERKHVETSNVSHDEALPFSYRKTVTVNNTRKSNKSTETAVNCSQQRSGLALFSREIVGKCQSVRGLSMIEELEDTLLHVRLDDGDSTFSLLNRNVPVYMNCPHCKSSTKQSQQGVKFASTVSQLQRIFLVTPPLPTVLATCPVIQFEEKCLPPSTPVLEQKLCFTLGCRVILPPESFLAIRLPFVYGLQKADGSLQPLSHLKHQPEQSAWLLKCTALQVVSMGHDKDEKLHVQ